MNNWTQFYTGLSYLGQTLLLVVFALGGILVGGALALLLS